MDDIPAVLVTQLAKFVTGLKIFGERTGEAVAKKVPRCSFYVHKNSCIRAERFAFCRAVFSR